MPEIHEVQDENDDCLVLVRLNETDNPNDLNIKFEHVSGNSQLMAMFAAVTMNGAEHVQNIQVERY